MTEEQEIIRYSLRIPAGLHARLVMLAKRERRSLHSEMLRLLEEAVEREALGKAANAPE